jgi:hypothetical protein
MMDVRQHMLKCNVEVLVILEGVDATTSSAAQARAHCGPETAHPAACGRAPLHAHRAAAAAQARQSYTVDDIGWDATFVPCARRQPSSGAINIDFEKLHQVLPLSSLTPSCVGERPPALPPALELPSPLRAPALGALLSSQPQPGVSFQGEDVGLLRSPPRPFLRALAAPSAGPCLNV